MVVKTVSSGGIPVTEKPSGGGTPVYEGEGIPVVKVASGGIPVTYVS